MPGLSNGWGITAFPALLYWTGRDSSMTCGTSWEHVHLSVSVAVAQQMHLAVFVSVDKAKPEYFEASVAVDKDMIQ